MTKTVIVTETQTAECAACGVVFETPSDNSCCPECGTEFCDCRVPGVPCPHHNRSGER